MNFESIVQNVARHIDLTTDEIKWFTSILEQKTFRKKEYALRANEVCRFQTYVVKGCLKITFTDKDGTENVAKFAIEDWWAFDLQSFMTQTPALYSIQAIEETESFQISRSNYDLLHESIPKFEKFSRIMFQNSYIQLQSRMTQNLFATGEEKYSHFNEKYPGLELRIPQKEIAAYLGITPEFLSMLRKKRTIKAIS
ncbi:Crp/Fnr family transcriptional regulator [Chryseolinea sp. T2]|uniref:Crp/Fnr family transcriptional regulator n=1 Tax=Chryseolinea sp. T2 TaxID=3129255 RepID=UPI0030775DA8